jgi:biotin---protein ligase
LDKIGGILVTSEFMGSQFAMTIGCGLNVCNSKPTVCLQDMISGTAHVDIETVLASIMVEFELLYTEMMAKGDADFTPFLSRYYSYWLHT